MYICKRCNYSSLYKRCIIQHLKNKKICKVILEDIDINILLDEFIVKTYNDIRYECDLCNKQFNCRSSMYRHIKTCNKKLKKRNINFECIAHIINVNLKDFGRENMNALPLDLIGNLFMNLKFRELLENLHCDPNFPDNHNIKITSIKRNVMGIYRNNKWEIVTFVNGLNELLLQGHKIFIDYYKNNKDKILEEDMSERDLNELLNILDNIEKLNNNDIKSLQMELQLMLETHRIKNNKKMLL